MENCAMRTIKALVAAVAMMAMHGAAVAQDWPPEQGVWSGPMPGFGWLPYGGPGSGPMRARSTGSGQALCTAAAGHVDSRLAAIKAELKITPAQEALWSAYAAAAHDSVNAALARCTALASQRGNTSVSVPDRFDQDEKLLAAQLHALRAMTAALKPLYAALSDSQKTSADHVSWSPMGTM
jgi:hypothetical protein